VSTVLNAQQKMRFRPQGIGGRNRYAGRNWTLRVYEKYMGVSYRGTSNARVLQGRDG